MNRLEEVELKEFKLADYNPRHMPPSEMAKLIESIERFGFISPVIARAEDKLVLGGHQRLAALGQYLEKRGMTAEEISAYRVPAMLVHGLSDIKAKALNLALNKISGEWDFLALNALLTEISTSEEFDVLGTGFDLREIEDILSVSSVTENAPATATTPEELQSIADAAVGEAMHDRARRLVIEFETPAQLEKVKEVLTKFTPKSGQQKGQKALAVAVVKCAEAASKYIALHPEVHAETVQKKSPRKKESKQ